MQCELDAGLHKWLPGETAIDGHVQRCGDAIFSRDQICLHPVKNGRELREPLGIHAASGPRSEEICEVREILSGGYKVFPGGKSGNGTVQLGGDGAIHLAADAGASAVDQPHIHGDAAQQTIQGGGTVWRDFQSIEERYTAIFRADEIECWLEELPGIVREGTV